MLALGILGTYHLHLGSTGGQCDNKFWGGCSGGRWMHVVAGVGKLWHIDKEVRIVVGMWLNRGCVGVDMEARTHNSPPKSSLAGSPPGIGIHLGTQ